MEESRLLGLLQRHDPDMRFEVQLRKPIPASRVPADRRRYVSSRAACDDATRPARVCESEGVVVLVVV